MKQRAVVAVGVLALVVIGGGWWLHDRSGAPPAPAPSPSAPPVARAAAPPAVAIEAPPPIVLDGDPVGALRLEGQVVDAGGHAVAGATVVLASRPPRTATTEADGSFAFDRLLGRSYMVLARTATAVAGPLTVHLTEHSDPVVLRLSPGAVVTVAVVRKDGVPTDGAVVELRGIDAVRAAVAHGSATFSGVVPGRYQLAAWAEGTARAYQGLDVGTGDTAAQLILVPGAQVAGRVVDDRGAAVAGARVVVRGASEWVGQADDQRDAVLTGRDGAFRFDAVPAGSFRFAASHAELGPGESPLITCDGIAPRDGVVIALAAGAVVRGRVVDAQRRPVGSARVRIAVAPSASALSFEPGRQAYSDAQGAFELRGLPRKPLTASARHEIGASQPVAIDAARGDVSGVTLTLDVTGVISGIVVDPLHAPVEGVRVMIGLALEGNRDLAGAGRGQAREFPEDRTDAAGKFALTGLLTGRYRVVAIPPTRTPGIGDLRSAVMAMSGDTHVELVVVPDGALSGRVAFSDGRTPAAFVVAVEHGARSFLGGDGAFELDSLAPGSHQLEVRGPGFQTRKLDVQVESSRTTDVGTITVVPGREIAGTVVMDGQPVAGATVYAGHTLIGTGTESARQSPSRLGGDSAKTATTDARGSFSISGLGGGDITLVAEQTDVGRSRALRIPEAMPGQGGLTISIERYGALRGVLRQTGQPTDSVAVTCQSTSTPGAVYRVLVGSDGTFRFDRLAPDVYKVSAALRTGRFGTRFYSREVTVQSGQEATVDLSVDPGAVALTVTAIASPGPVGTASAWLASGTIAASTMTELSLRLASAGPGTSVRLTIVNGEPTQFTDLSPGLYTMCITPLPLEVKSQAALDYVLEHGDTLATFCKPVDIAPSPAAQAVQVPVVVPALAPAGPGRAPGSGATEQQRRQLSLN